MVRFYSYEGRVLRLLVAVGKTSWMIDYENPGSPFALSESSLNSLEKIPTPDDFLDESDVSPKRKATMEKRFAIIDPLLHNSVFITDEKIRRRCVENIAKQHDLSARTIYRFFFMYLAKGKRGLLPGGRSEQAKESEEKCQRIMRQAINEFYYSPRRPSVKVAYELMLMKCYRTEEGILLDTRPSFNQFRYALQASKDVSKEIIAREGLGEFKKNFRPLLGNGDSGVENIGLYEIDATVADIYVVSKYDRMPIGRPILYVAVDIASRLIAGIHVSLDENAEAVMCCLRNAATDKVEFCASYGIHIEKEQWPSNGMPGYICTDRGTDFISNRCKELCTLFGVEITSLPAYRPDLKGYVERAIGCMERRL